jgi:EmrB/QacA subfamily drug resistance transporter
MFRSTKGDQMSEKAKWLAFSTALAATLMDLLDTTIANVAGPVIQADLGGSYADLQWITAAYALAMAVGLITGGRLGDMFGRKRVLLAGCATFTLASVACAVAPSAEFLIAARAAQGLFGAVMVPQTFGLIRDLFGDEQHKAFAVLGPVCGLAAMVGPIVAGLMIDLDLFGTGWRSIFLLNVPVAAFVLIGGARLLPASTSHDRSLRLDLGGMALAGAGTFMVVYPLVQGREQGWPAWMVALGLGALPVFALFAACQRGRRRAGAAPLVEPSIFGRRAYVSGVAFAVVFIATMSGLGLALGVFLQVGMGWTPIHAALASAPFALGGFFGSAAGAMVVEKLGRRVLQVGLVFMGVGVLGCEAVLSASGTGLGSFDLVGPLAIAGVGLGMVFVVLFDIVLGGVQPHEMGSAAGVLQAMQQLGSSLGVAVIGTVLFGALGARADHTADVLHATQITFWVVGGLIVLAFVIAFQLPRGQQRPIHEAVAVLSA